MMAVCISLGVVDVSEVETPEFPLAQGAATWHVCMKDANEVVKMYGQVCHMQYSCLECLCMVPCCG